MGQSMGSAPAEELRGEIHELGRAKLVVEHVEIVRQRETIKVPHVVYEDVPTVRYTVQEQPTTKYIAGTATTTNYVATEKETVKYNVREEQTIKYIPKEVVVEKPVVHEKIIEVIYEKPVIIEKEYTVLASKDMVLIKELATMVPKLLDELAKLRKYTLVEEIVKVPKLQYEPITVERVVWKDSARCSKCGGLTNADQD